MMQDTKIIEFLENKINDFVKKKTNTNSSNEEKLIIKQQAQEKFSLQNWLIDASSRASQLSLTTHPPKFSHPDAKIDTIIATCLQANDGLVRTGNIPVDLDVVGNAASLDVHKFLFLKLDNELTILENLEQNTDYIQGQFNFDSYAEIRNNFLKIKKTNSGLKTNDKIKQIYFPVENDYHLLSILTPSGVVYKLKEKINNIKFSETNSGARDEARKENAEFNGKIEDIWNLTQIGYGGTKPQNISVMNNKNGGVAYLLNSMPPTLTKRKVQPPKTNFFKTNIWLNDYLKQDFDNLYQMLQDMRSNKKIRDKRDFIILNIMHQVKRNVDKVRAIDSGWSKSDTYKKLEFWQKVLLDDKYLDIRGDKEQNDDFLTKTCEEFSRWFVLTYRRLFNESSLADTEINHIKSVVKDEMEVFL
jgi:CRISPR-associated protein Csy1